MVKHRRADMVDYLGDDSLVDRCSSGGRKATPVELLHPKGVMRMREWELRGALAELLLASPFGRISAAPVKKTERFEDFASVIRSGAMEPLDPGDEKTLRWRWTAHCTVRRQPTLVEALFKTSPASAKEAGAFRKLGETMQTCAPDGNLSFALVADGMRLLLAEALLGYRAEVPARKPSRNVRFPPKTDIRQLSIC